MKEETNEKVLAMYKAVCILIEEGCELTGMKVSDITARAGIGKGTAYEYFRSKEEILMRAMEYEFMQQYQELKRSLEQEVTFRGAMERVFDWLDRNIRRKRLAYQTLKFVGEIQKKAKESQKDCVRQKMKKRADLFDELLDYMTELGKKEGIIRSEIPEKLVRVELCSRFTGYFLHFQSEDKNESENRLIRDFLYENMIKGLG